MRYTMILCTLILAEAYNPTFDPSVGLLVMLIGGFIWAAFGDLSELSKSK